MTAYLSFVIDSLRALASASVLLIPIIVFLSRFSLIDCEDAWRETWKKWALIAGMAFAAALVFVGVVPDAETRKAIAVELKGLS